MVSRKPVRLCIVSYPFSERTKVYNLLTDFVKLAGDVAGEVVVVTGNLPEAVAAGMGHPVINHRVGKSLRRDLPSWLALTKWFFGYARTQLLLSWSLLRLSPRYDIAVFFLGYNYPLPALAARLAGKKTCTVITLPAFSAVAEGYPAFVNGYFHLTERLLYALSHKLLVDPGNDDPGLRHYHKKRVVTRRFIDLEKFKVQLPWPERATLVGFIGRLSPEKGILRFIDAIPAVLRERGDVRFIIGGDGPLLDEVRQHIKSHSVEGAVEMVGWISRDDLSGLLNRLQVLVIASDYETGPAIALEAMACGTLVVTPPVGLMKSLLSDGINGFMVADNSPRSLATGILRALACPEAADIAVQGHELVASRYSFRTARDDCRRAFAEMLDE